MKTPLPTNILLPVYNGTWQIEYRPSPFIGRTMLIEVAPYQLAYVGKADESIMHKKVSDFVSMKARQYLSPRIQHWSQQCEWPFKQLRFGTQKTRWGSCTSQKTISLNEKLIFLESHLIDYVLIHELAHTIELNHSDRFWLLVEKHVPHYRTCLQELKKVHIPNWFALR